MIKKGTFDFFFALCARARRCDFLYGFSLFDGSRRTFTVGFRPLVLSYADGFGAAGIGTASISWASTAAAGRVPALVAVFSLDDLVAFGGCAGSAAFVAGVLSVVGK